jgi:hypothetical protein
LLACQAPYAVANVLPRRQTLSEETTNDPESYPTGMAFGNSVIRKTECLCRSQTTAEFFQTRPSRRLRSEEAFVQHSSTSPFDWRYLEALRYMAVIHDILAICEAVSPGTVTLLERAVGSLGLAVLTLVPKHVFDEIAQRITEATNSVTAADPQDWPPFCNSCQLTRLVDENRMECIICTAPAVPTVLRHRLSACTQHGRGFG